MTLDPDTNSEEAVDLFAEDDDEDSKASAGVAWN